MSFVASLRLFCHCLDPLGAFRESKRGKKLIENYPLSLRVTLVGANACIGLVKPFFLPLISLILCVTQPLLSLFYFVKNDPTTGYKLLQSSCFSLITFAGTIGVMYMIVNYLSIMQGTYATLALCSLSLIIHVYRAV